MASIIETEDGTPCKNGGSFSRLYQDDMRYPQLSLFADDPTMRSTSSLKDSPYPQAEVVCEVSALRKEWMAIRDLILGSADNLKGNLGDEEVLAQKVCALLLQTLWTHSLDDETARPEWSPDVDLPLTSSLDSSIGMAASILGRASCVEIGYLVGGLYTALLPSEVRARRGAYYTPPEIADRLLDLVEAEGMDWSKGRILDPACGGGAFLVPVTQRILADPRVSQLPADQRLSHLERHLVGIEIDPFAAWMTRVLLSFLCADLCEESGRHLEPVILVADALDEDLLTIEPFDLVVGNPPYGRIQLSGEKRQRFRRSLYGHANLYGLFLDAALRWRSASGLIAYITPTSFLGGQYFHKLRHLLVSESTPLVIDIFADRTGVFESVQQETCLAVFGPSEVDRETLVHHLQMEDSRLVAHRSGRFSLAGAGHSGGPWLLPRSRDQASLVKRSSHAKTRLEDLGYKVSTGPLVWNRHKDDLRPVPEESTLPLIWAEAVRPTGFDFNYRTRSHAPFFLLGEDQEHLVEKRPAALVQRTTAKEQRRRLVACAIPLDFFHRWGGVVVENHVNVLRPVNECLVSPEALAAVLNTKVMDELFRCLSGTVAVSASELHALPPPDVSVFHEIQSMLDNENGSGMREALDALVLESLMAGADS